MTAIAKERQETMPTAIEAYTPTALALADLNARYADVVFDVSAPAGMKEAKEARAEIKGYRVDLEKTRVAIKADALAQCKLIDTEAGRIKAALEALEDPIDQQIKAEEKRKEAARVAAKQAEMERVQRIQQSIIAIRSQPVTMAGKPSAEIRDVLAGVEELEITDERYAEFTEHAADAKAEAVAALSKLAEDTERLEAERAELARFLQEAEARAQEEAARKAEEQRLADEQRAREQAELQAERERIANERAEHEAKMQAEREAAERVEAERRRAIEEERQRLAAEQAEAQRRADQLRREEEYAKAQEQRRLQEEREAAETAAYAEKQRREREATEQSATEEMENEVAVLISGINMQKIKIVDALRFAYKAGVNAERRRHA